MEYLNGKVAIVTGSASGLGHAIASRLASDGASVVLTDINEEAGKARAEQLHADFLSHDVTDERRWSEVVNEVARRHSRLDILVNNAGILGEATDTDPETASYANWSNVMRVNGDSVFLGCRTAIQTMRALGRGGSIVNIASVASEKGASHAIAYGASKSVVTHITRSVAQYCAAERTGIRCNSVHPGDVHTPLHDRRAIELAGVSGASPEAVLSSVGQSVGGWIPIDQVAAAVSYLCSDEAKSITGTKLVVDGGLLA